MRTIKYITLNGRIPSYTADGIAVMNTCHYISKNGFNLSLIIPDEMGLGKKKYNNEWSFYGLEKNFNIKKIRTPFTGMLSSILFLLKIACLSFRGKQAIYHVRHIQLAVVVGILGRITIFESHNFKKAQNSKLLFHLFIFLIKRNKSISIISTTHAGAEAYQQCGVPADKIKVLPNGVDVRKFNDIKTPKDILRSELKIPKYQNVACHAGSLYEGRGIEEVLYAAKKLPDVLFLFVGGPQKRVDYYENYCSEKGVKNVLFVGFIQQDKLHKYILASDFVLMPYTSKTKTKEFMSPMKMFDYLASGRPIIATDFPVISEILDHRENAILVEPDSGRAIYDGIKLLTDSPELSAKIGKNALEEAEKYTWKIRGKEISDWYKINLISNV